MEGLDYLGPEGGRLALAFASGCVFTAGVLWKFIIEPLKKDLASETEDAKAARLELANSYLEDRNFYREYAAQGRGGTPNV